MMIIPLSLMYIVVKGVLPNRRALLASSAFFALGCWQLFGGLQYYENVGELSETYIGRGLITIACALSIILFSLPYIGRWAWKCLMFFAVLAMLVIMLQWSIWYFISPFLPRPHILREEAPIVFLGTIALSLFARSNVPSGLAGALFALFSMLMNKFTVYMSVAGVAFVFLARLSLNRNNKRSLDIWILRISLMIVGLFLVFFVYVVFNMILELLPDGSAAMRERTYEARLEEFFNQPIFGSGFQSSPIMTVAWLRVPSHSDLLDILAHGGFAGAILVAIPFIVCIPGMFPVFSRKVSEEDELLLFSAATFVAIFLFSLAVNPLWHQSHMMIVGCAALGVLCGKFSAIKRFSHFGRRG